MTILLVTPNALLWRTAKGYTGYLVGIKTVVAPCCLRNSRSISPCNKPMHGVTPNASDNTHHLHRLRKLEWQAVAQQVSNRSSPRALMSNTPKHCDAAQQRSGRIKLFFRITEPSVHLPVNRDRYHKSSHAEVPLGRQYSLCSNKRLFTPVYITQKTVYEPTYSNNTIRITPSLHNMCREGEKKYWEWNVQTMPQP